jgi:selenocysteine lyase/cysteine desulfurase
LGTGVLCIGQGVESKLHPVREGGTGSVSERDTQPDMLPDKYESGSHNTLGIVGLSAGVQWILDKGVSSLWEHEQTLVAGMLDAFLSGKVPDVQLVGPVCADQRCAVFSIHIDGMEPNALSSILEDRFGLLTRAGLHCAPRAHRTFGTDKHGGTVRVSFGAFNTIDDVHAVCEALASVGSAFSSPVSSSSVS